MGDMTKEVLAPSKDGNRLAKGSVVPARGKGGKGSKAGPPADENLQGGNGSEAGSNETRDVPATTKVSGMTPAQMALERARPSIALKIQEKWAAKKREKNAESEQQNKDTVPLADTKPRTQSRDAPIPPADSAANQNPPAHPLTVKNSNVRSVSTLGDAATKTIKPLVKADRKSVV